MISEKVNKTVTIPVEKQRVTSVWIAILSLIRMGMGDDISAVLVNSSLIGKNILKSDSFFIQHVYLV